MDNMTMANDAEMVVDIVAEMRENKGFSVPYTPDGVKAVWTTDLVEYADRIEAACKVMRVKLYGIARGLHALAAMSDARQRGISYTVLQDTARQIENIADAAYNESEAVNG